MRTLLDLQRSTGAAVRVPVGETLDPSTVAIGRNVTDSRLVEPGDVFWAMPGERRNGAQFVVDALDAGAIGAVVDRPVPTKPERWIATVDETRKALAQFAAWNRRNLRGTLVALTGSEGRQTSRRMIQTVLAERFSGVTFPNDDTALVGLSLNLLDVTPEQDYAVFELGTGRIGELAGRTRLISPGIGVITQVGDSNQVGFGNLRAEAEAQAELLGAIPNSGHAVLVDDPWLRRLAATTRVPVTWIGTSGACDLSATNLRFRDRELLFRADGCAFRVPALNRRQVTSALVAVAVGRLMGIATKEIAESLARFEPIPTHCRVSTVLGATVLHDSGDSTEPDVELALKILRDFDTEHHRIVVLGEMNSGSDDPSRWHRRLGRSVVARHAADLLIAHGQYSDEVVAAARAAGMNANAVLGCETAHEAFALVSQSLTTGDVVLLKGAGAATIESMIEALQYKTKNRAA